VCTCVRVGPHTPARAQRMLGSLRAWQGGQRGKEKAGHTAAAIANSMMNQTQSRVKILRQGDGAPSSFVSRRRMKRKRMSFRVPKVLSSGSFNVVRDVPTAHDRLQANQSTD
jgi:hypothetical protein